MALNSNPPLNGPSEFTSQRSGEGRSDTLTAKPTHMMRDGIQAKRMNQRLPRKPSKIFKGLQTLYG